MCVAGSCCRCRVFPVAVAAWLKFGKACRRQWSRMAVGRPGEEQAMVTWSTRTLVPRKGGGRAWEQGQQGEQPSRPIRSDSLVLNAALSHPRYEYHWADGTNIKKPIKCSAPKYIDYLMTWVQDQLDDETLFPSKIGG